jgi:hypothetical protein
MIEKQFDLIDKEDIEALLTNKIIESKTIEYKRDLPGNGDEAKREFLADVSSFANSAGGDLIFGIKEKKGIPEEIIGISEHIDSVKLRLENSLRDNIEPRIPGIQIHSIEGFQEGPVLIIRIPQSWSSPHMVSFKKSSKFYTRNSAGKHQMDVSEIRSSFLLSEALPERIKRFRDDRLSKIISNEAPVLLPQKPMVVLHLIPISSFSTVNSFDIRELNEKSKYILPFRSGCNTRINLDGILKTDDFNKAKNSYCQIFRTGIIESLWLNLCNIPDEFKIPNGDLVIPGLCFENKIIETLADYISFLSSIEMRTPWFLFICLLNVKNAYIAGSSGRDYTNDPIDRNNLIIPEVIIEDVKLAPTIILKPIFDAVWNAGGLDGSPTYNAKGERTLVS